MSPGHCGAPPATGHLHTSASCSREHSDITQGELSEKRFYCRDTTSWIRVLVFSPYVQATLDNVWNGEYTTQRRCLTVASSPCKKNLSIHYSQPNSDDFADKHPNFGWRQFVFHFHVFPIQGEVTGRPLNSVHRRTWPTCLEQSTSRHLPLSFMKISCAQPWFLVRAFVCSRPGRGLRWCAANFLWKSTSLKCFSSSLNLKYFKIYYINMSVLMVLEGVLIKTKKDDI